MKLIYRFNLIFLIGIVLFILSGCDYIDREISKGLDQNDPSAIIMPNNYVLRVWNSSDFNINLITKNEKTIIEPNIISIGWNQNYIYFEYVDIETSKVSKGYINLKTNKLSLSQRESNRFMIAKMDIYTPKELYEKKYKRIYRLQIQYKKMKQSLVEVFSN